MQMPPQKLNPSLFIFCCSHLMPLLFPMTFRGPTFCVGLAPYALSHYRLSRLLTVVWSTGVILRASWVIVIIPVDSNQAPNPACRRRGRYQL
ncbi:hypothetical protein GGI35DRAFT_461302 [Trichoderma velutinum]